MKNFLTCLIVSVCVMLLSVTATARKLRPVQMKVKSDLSKEVELQHKQAQEEWKQKLKNKVWFANRSLRQQCEEVLGCDSWAKHEFEKDSTFHVSHVQVSHEGIIEKDNKRVISKISVQFLFTNAKHPRGRVKTFAFKNVPLNSKKCFDCENFRSNYMGSASYESMEGTFR